MAAYRPEETPTPIDRKRPNSIPEGVNLDEISDETISMLGLDPDHIKELKLSLVLEKIKSEGERHYREHNDQREDPMLKETGHKIHLVVDSGLDLSVTSGLDTRDLPQEMMQDFQSRTPTEETGIQEKKIKAWISGFMEGAFEEKDWLAVVNAADSIGEGLANLPRLKSIAQQDPDNEGLRIAQAIEDSRKAKEKVSQDKLNEDTRPAPSLESPPGSDAT